MNQSNKRNSLGNILWGTFGGALWGLSWGSAIMGIIIGTPNNLITLFSGIILGVLWCVTLSLLWKYLMAKEGDSHRNYITTGILWGLLLGAALSGIGILLATRDFSLGDLVFFGAAIGAIFGFFWSLFKPPLLLKVSRRIWGIKGAFLGAIWGAFLGTIVGVLITVILLMRNKMFGEFPPLDELGKLLTIAVIFGGGNGAIGGLISGIIFGGIITARPLPIAIELSGKRGAFVGAIWGCFLSAIAFSILGAIFSIIEPNLFLNTGLLNRINLFTGTIIGAGLGATWGMFSGAMWGGMGKW